MNSFARLIGLYLLVTAMALCADANERFSPGFVATKGKKSDDSTSTVDDSAINCYNNNCDDVDYVAAGRHMLIADKRNKFGFQGTRGKKITDDLFKRTMGFTAVRGKKFVPYYFNRQPSNRYGRTPITNNNDDDFYQWTRTLFHGKQLGNKRKFYGMRGKRFPDTMEALDVRGKKRPSANAFYGTRGKKWTEFPVEDNNGFVYDGKSEDGTTLVVMPELNGNDDDVDASYYLKPVDMSGSDDNLSYGDQTAKE